MLYLKKWWISKVWNLMFLLRRTVDAPDNRQRGPKKDFRVQYSNHPFFGANLLLVLERVSGVRLFFVSNKCEEIERDTLQQSTLPIGDFFFCGSRCHFLLNACDLQRYFLGYLVFQPSFSHWLCGNSAISHKQSIKNALVKLSPSPLFFWIRSVWNHDVKIRESSLLGSRSQGPFEGQKVDNFSLTSTTTFTQQGS